MERNTLTRRDFLGLMPTALCGLALLAGSTPSNASAAEAATPAKPRPPCPPRTCGGWADRGHNGICDRSENGGACKALKCPAHSGNLERLAALKSGAPAGICGLWSDPAKKGFCAMSARDAHPCPYAVCPAHRSKAATPTPAAPQG